MLGDNIVKDFQALINIKWQIEVLKSREKNLRKNIQSCVVYLGMPISHDGWNASLRTNTLRVTVDWTKMQKERVDLFISLMMSGMVKFTEPTQENSLVFGKIKEKKK